MKKLGIFYLILFTFLNVRAQNVGSHPESGNAVGTADSRRYRVGADGWVDFAQFKPAGNGTTDDTPKLLHAFDYCRTNKVGLLVDPTKTYLLKTPIDYAFAGTLAIKSKTIGKLAVFLLPDTELFPVLLSAREGDLNTKVTKDIKAGEKTITVASTSGLKVGDLIVIRSTSDWPIESDTKKAECNLVEAISGKVITLRQPCQDTYKASEIKQVVNFQPATLRLQDLEFRVRQTGNNSVVGLGVMNMQNSVIDRVTIRNAQYASSQFYGCYNTEIANCVFEKANEEGQGYGLATVGGILYNVHDNRSYGCRKLCDFSGDSRFGATRNSKAIGNVAVGDGTTNRGNELFRVQSFCVATHGGADGILIQGNTAVNCRTGFQLRGRNVTLRDNKILGMSEVPISLSGGQNHTVTGNVYTSLIGDKKNPDYSRYPRAVIGLASTLLADGQIVIKNNTFDFVRNYGIYGDGVRQKCLIQSNHFVFNALGGADPNPVLVYFEEIDRQLTGLQVRDNTFGSSGAVKLKNLMALVRKSSYANGNLLDWASCEVQGLRASDIVTLKAESGENPVQKSIDKLKIDKKDNVISLSGEFGFKFNTAVRPVFIGMPVTKKPLNQNFTFKVLTDNSSRVGKLAGEKGQVLFGAQAGSYGATYQAKTDFAIGVDLTYSTQ
ncbi:hypothetical protein ACO2Q8_13755 [Larkinella sp. VNQ87]|uniref:hypothetical protein n=1 Tax=Larkinella sp. VNQ87 TaxID=3400921 RepID=UPI003C05982E